MSIRNFVLWRSRDTVVVERRRYGWLVIDRATGAAALGPTLEKARAALRLRADGTPGREGLAPSSTGHPDWPVKDAALR